MAPRQQVINHLERKRWNEATIERLGLHSLHLGHYVVYTDEVRNSSPQTNYQMHIKLEQFLIELLAAIENLKGAYQANARKP